MLAVRTLILRRSTYELLVQARAGGPELFRNQGIRLAAAGRCHLAVVAEDGAL